MTEISATTFQALDADGMDMEIDLSNLGTVNTMFAALFRCNFILIALGKKNFILFFRS